MAAYMARNRCLAFCWKYVQLGYISGLALPYCLLRRIKKHIQPSTAFYRSSEVPVLTGNKVFVSSLCIAEQLQLQPAAKSLGCREEIWSFGNVFAKRWSWVLSAYIFLISNL